METKKENIEHIPELSKSLRCPRYWDAWLSMAAIAGTALTPVSFRDPILTKFGRMIGHLGKNSRRRALVNLSLCFPRRSEAECEAIVDEIFVAIPQAMVMMAELVLRGLEKIRNRADWQGLEVIEEMRRNDEKVIFLVPHSWGVDTPAMLMVSQGQKMVIMFHNQENPVSDYIWDTVRRRLGGRLYVCNDGTKPFIQPVRRGYWGCYLPDQDYGPERGEFVDFLATCKATLPAIGRLIKVCHAHVVSLFSVYDGKTHRLTIRVRPPMDDILTVDDHIITRRVNEEAEIFVTPHVEQYTWILRLLKTRRPGETEPYKHKDLYPKR